MIKESILDTIGNTPVIRLSRLEKVLNLKGELYAKIEYYSPGLSKKDRIAKYMIEKSIKEGKLKKGQTVIEKTSGNTGIGLAVVCSVLGYPFVAVMSRGNSEERVRMIEAFNGKVVLVDQDKNSIKNKVSNKDLELVDREYKRLIKELDAYPVNQFDNEDNPDSHYLLTGEEIVKDLPDVDIFVDYIGTGGSFCGISKRLKENNPNVISYIIEPEKEDHIIQGGGYLKDIPFLDDSLVNGKIVISEEEALNAMDLLSRYEGICGGISSGANLSGAIKAIEKHEGKKVVFLVNDVFLKYNSIIETKKDN